MMTKRIVAYGVAVVLFLALVGAGSRTWWAQRIRSSAATRTITSGWSLLEAGA